MRSNLPVTGIEYPMQEGQSIVSKTDTKGRITYVNRSFIEVSGFTEDELLGKAHNIVRHAANRDQPGLYSGQRGEIIGIHEVR